jgi:hypothetical protein
MHLRGLHDLEHVNLEGTNVTDAVLVSLEGFTKLERLDLDGTRITNDGLVHLKGLRYLGVLSIKRTKTTTWTSRAQSDAAPGPHRMSDWPSARAKLVPGAVTPCRPIGVRP